MEMIERDNAAQIVENYCQEFARASGDAHYLELAKHVSAAFFEAPTLRVFAWHEYPAEKPQAIDELYDCLCLMPQAHGTFKTELRSLTYRGWNKHGPWGCDGLIVVAWRQSTLPSWHGGLSRD